MPDTLSQSLQTWQNFCLLMGGASATLVGLMFVAIWLGSNFFTEQTVVELRTFVSPTLMHFVYVLIASAVVVIPTVARTFLGILLLRRGSSVWGSPSAASPTCTINIAPRRPT